MNNKIQKVPELMWSIHHLRHENHCVSIRACVQWHGVQMFYSQTVNVQVKLTVHALKAYDVCWFLNGTS